MTEDVVDTLGLLLNASVLLALFGALIEHGTNTLR